MRFWIAACFGAVLLVAAPAAADVAVTGTTSGKAVGIGGSAKTVTYIKGTKMRSETHMGDRILVSIMDLDAQRFISLDTKKKEAEIYDLRDIAKGMSEITESDIEVSFKPSGQTKQVAGYTCAGYDTRVVVPFAAGGDAPMKIVMSGPAWLAKDAPGQADYAAFYKAAAEKGFIFGDPRAAKAQPGQSKGMTLLYREMAGAGLPCAMDLTIKFEGGGPMAGLMSRMGGSTMSTELQQVSTDALGDDLFAVPAGYKTKNR